MYGSKATHSLAPVDVGRFTLVLEAHHSRFNRLGFQLGYSKGSPELVRFVEPNVNGLLIWRRQQCSTCSDRQVFGLAGGFGVLEAERMIDGGVFLYRYPFGVASTGN